MFDPSLVQNDLNYQYGGSTCHAYATQSCNQYIFKKGYSTLGGRGWGQLMGIRAEIGMPSFFLQSGDSGIGRVERLCGEARQGQGKRSCGGAEAKSGG